MREIGYLMCYFEHGKPGITQWKSDRETTIYLHKKQPAQIQVCLDTAKQYLIDSKI